MNRLLRGLLAGAAGTMALDLATYADMAIRGRSSSSVPATVIARIAARMHLPALSPPPETAPEGIKNRQSALGALSGYAVGLGIGAVYGIVRPHTNRVPLAGAALIAGALAMAASDVPAATLGATDMRTWGVEGWIADAIPHALYGLVTALTFERIS